MENLQKIGLEELTSQILLDAFQNEQSLTLEEITKIIQETKNNVDHILGNDFNLSKEEVEITPGGHIFKHLRAFIGNMEDFKRAQHGTPKTRLLEDGKKELTAKLQNFSAINPRFIEVKKVITKLVNAKKDDKK